MASLTAPIEGGLADRLERLHRGLTDVPSPALANTGDVASFARSSTAFTRAFSESSLKEGIYKFGSGDPAALADRFSASMEAALAARPRAYPFDDLTLSVIVRRRP
jgi:hypothetical protein